MKRHSRSIYGCKQAPAEYVAPQDCRFTFNPQTRRLYVHVFAWPFVELHLDGLAGKVEYAQLLNDASEVKIIEHDPNRKAYLTGMGTTPGTVILELPIQKPDVVVPVVELFLKE